MEALLGTSFDYMEVILMVNGPAGAIGRSYDIPKTDFNMYLCRMKQWPNMKCFQADSKEYEHRNLQLVKKIKDNEVQESKVYQTTPVYVLDEGNCRIVAFDKKKLSTVVFQSSKCYDQIKHKRKLIFRVNNKIFVNFQQEFVDDKIFRKIYVNFNNNKDADMKDSFETVSQLVKDIFN